MLTKSYSSAISLRYLTKFPASLDTLTVSVPPAVKLSLGIFWLKDESLEDSANFPTPTSSPPNEANGMSDIEGKVTRVGARERGQRTSFKSLQI